MQPDAHHRADRAHEGAADRRAEGRAARRVGHVDFEPRRYDDSARVVAAGFVVIVRLKIDRAHVVVEPLPVADADARVGEGAVADLERAPAEEGAVADGAAAVGLAVGECAESST